MLNAHYVALRIISARRAFGLLFKENGACQPVAEVVSVEDGKYLSYNFEDWRQLSELRRQFEPAKHDWVRTVRFHLAVPRIVRVFSFNKLPREGIKFNRRNIYARDQNRCQYCGKRYPTSELSLDHVVPRSHNGPTCWSNIVCSCLTCNVRKGGRTPQQAGMQLVHKPAKPRMAPVVNFSLSKSKYSSWQQFLDHAYWNVELQ